jgi:hypothetical protein
MTDEALVCERVGKEFAGHGTVKHSEDEYTRTGGFHHTNTVEPFVSSLIDRLPRSRLGRGWGGVFNKRNSSLSRR